PDRRTNHVVPGHRPTRTANHHLAPRRGRGRRAGPAGLDAAGEGPRLLPATYPRAADRGRVVRRRARGLWLQRTGPANHVLDELCRLYARPVSRGEASCLHRRPIVRATVPIPLLRISGGNASCVLNAPACPPWPSAPRKACPLPPSTPGAGASNPLANRPPVSSRFDSSLPPCRSSPLCPLGRSCV